MELILSLSFKKVQGLSSARLTQMPFRHLLIISTISARFKMNSLKKMKMRKVKNLLSSKEDVSKVRTSLEQRTEKAFFVSS